MTAILADSNLLCLIVAGQFRPEAIGRHKKLKTYSKDDFDSVMSIADEFSCAVTCPPVITETSNLLATTHERERYALLEGLAQIVSSADERQVAAISVCRAPIYHRLGFTDAVLLTAELSDAVLLTADLDLALAAQAAKRSVINYNWVRDGLDWRDQIQR